MSAHDAFRRLDREVLIDNAWHRYCRDRYVQRDGSEGEYYYVDMPGSCASIPVYDDGTMVLIKAHRYLLGLDLWEFPSGGIEVGHEPLAVGHAVLREEAGLVADDWTPLGHFAPYKGVSNERCHFFLARQLHEVPQDPHAIELGLFPQVQHPEAGVYTTVNIPMRFANADVRPRGPSPAVGEHTSKVLLDNGFSQEEINSMFKANTIGGES